MSPESKISFSKMRSIFFFSIIFLLALAMLFLLRPFLFPIFWAAVIAIMFYPAYQWLLLHTKMPSMSAGITLLMVIATIILPLILISTLIVNESISFYDRFSQSTDFQNTSAISERLESSWLESYSDKIEEIWTKEAPNLTKRISTFLLSSLKDITQNTLRFLFLLFIMFYSLFYFLKDGPKLLQRLMHLSPLGQQYEEILYERFTSTARATLKGTLIVGSIQGIIGGLLFWATGIEGAFVWGVIMTGFAIIPAVGPSIVWFPTGLILLALGQTIPGLIILLVGIFVISLIDNILRPKLIGKDIQMHPLIAFFSTLGGLIAFGISGFVIGPVIAALYLAVMSMYDHYYKNELQNN